MNETTADANITAFRPGFVNRTITLTSSAIIQNASEGYNTSARTLLFRVKIANASDELNNTLTIGAGGTGSNVTFASDSGTAQYSGGIAYLNASAATANITIARDGFVNRTQSIVSSATTQNASEGFNTSSTRLLFRLKVLTADEYGLALSAVTVTHGGNASAGNTTNAYYFNTTGTGNLSTTKTGFAVSNFSAETGLVNLNTTTANQTVINMTGQTACTAVGIGNSSTCRGLLYILSITLNASTGSVGDVIRVNASNYPASQPNILIQFGGVNVTLTGVNGTGAGATSGTVNASSAGTWNATFSIPPRVNGSKALFATNGSTLLNGTSSYQVNSTITVISPTSGQVGSTVNVSGTGFAGSVAITVRIAGNTSTNTTASVTDVNGSFSANYTIPNLAAGAKTVNASDGNNTVQNASGFTVSSASISNVSPSSNQPGGVSVVTFIGFIANETLNITIDGAVAGSGSANSTGGGALNASYPGGRNPGSYTLLVIGSLSNASTSVTLSASSSSSSSGSSGTTSTTSTTTTSSPTTTTSTTPTTTTESSSTTTTTESTTTTDAQTQATITQTESTVSTASAAIATGDVTTATSLLTNAISNLDSVVTTTATTATVDQTTSVINSITAATAQLITSGATTQAATLLASISDTAGKLATTDNTAQASVVLNTVAKQADSLLAAGNTDAAQKVVEALTVAQNKVTESTTEVTSDLTGKGVDITNALGLADLGLSASDITAAVSKNAQAAALLEQAKTATGTEKSDALTQAIQLQREALSSLPEVKKVVSVSTPVTTTSESISSVSSQVTDSAAQSAVQSVQTSLAQGGDLVVQKDLATYKVSNKDVSNTEVDRSVISLKFRADKQLNNVKLVEVIPKSVANSASELIFSGVAPTILQDDPVVAWTFSSMSAGETKEVSYVAKQALTSAGSTTLAGGETVEAAPTEEAAVPTEGISAPSGIPTTLLLAIVVIIIIAAIAYFWSKNQEKGGKYSGYKKK